VNVFALRSRALRVTGSALVAGLILLSGCADGPRDIQMGAEECAHCRMMISEERFAAQLVTDRGMGYVFDSIECMAEFLDDAAEVSEDRVRSLWVTDFARPGEWVPAGEAHFLRSETLRSPMGLNLSAYSRGEDAREMQREHGGEILSWEAVRDVVAATDVIRSRGGGHNHGH
jgi:copper chaperone NosL